MLVEHLRRRVKVHKHEPSTRVHDGGYAFGPGFEVGKPAHDPVGGENDVEAPRDAGFHGELIGGGYGLVADVHAGNRGPEPGEAQRVSAGVALQVGERLAYEFAEESAFLGEEGDATLAQEGGEIPTMAVVRPHHRVPGTPVLLAKVPVDHGRILPREWRVARSLRASSRTRRKP